MSLRHALTMLTDDRGTVTAARAVISYFERHRDESVAALTVERATGLPPARVEPLMAALASALVLDCDGDPRLDECRYHPDLALELEVRRFLSAATNADNALQRRVDRFRGTYGTGR